jgi:hypothetical protein
MRWRMLLGCAALVGAASACASWPHYPQTSMVEVQDYEMRSGPSISGQPAYTAGPTYFRTASHDGSTFIVDCAGRKVGQVPGMVQNC